MTRRIYTKAVWQMTANGYEFLPNESRWFEYDGPVAHCGSLAYAVGGALAGAGQGAANVGAEAMRQQHDDGILRLQNWYAEQRQQTGIQAQQGLQQAGFTEQEKMHGVEHGEAVAAATTRAKVEEQRLQEQLAAKHQDVGTLAAARKYAADRGVDRAQYGAASRPKTLFKDGGYYKTPDTPAIDPKTGQPDLTQPKQPGQKIPTVIGPGGQRFIQVGIDKYAPFDPTKPLPTPNSLSRAPQADIQDAVNHPERIMPFLGRYGWVSAQHVQAGLQAAPGPQPGVPPSMPKGTTYVPPPAEPTASNARPASDDNSDAQDVQDDNYAMYGDAGHQASDDQPAQ